MNETTCHTNVRGKLAQEFNEVDLSICDKIIMTLRYNMETVDRILWDITRTNLPLDDEIVLFYRDFRQVLPVLLLG